MTRAKQCTAQANQRRLRSYAWPCEPYIIGATAEMPIYDERFVDYGCVPSTHYRPPAPAGTGQGAFAHAADPVPRRFGLKRPRSFALVRSTLWHAHCAARNNKWNRRSNDKATHLLELSENRA